MNLIIDWYERTRQALSSEKGQTLVEYALLLVLIAVVVIAMVQGVGKEANNAFSTINSGLVPAK